MITVPPNDQEVYSIGSITLIFYNAHGFKQYIYPFYWVNTSYKEDTSFIRKYKATF